MSEVKLQSQIDIAEEMLAEIPVDIEFPRSLQRACVFLVMEEITLDQFINCLISEIKFDGTGQKLISLMMQMKLLVKACKESEFKANMLIMQLMTELQIKFVQQEII